MGSRPHILVWVIPVLLLLAAGPAPAQDEAGEVRVRVVDNYPYDLVFLAELSQGCPEEGLEFILEPETIPFFTSGRLAFRADCPVRVVYGLRFFTDVFLTLFYDPVKERLLARSSSVILDTRVSSKRGEEGERLFTVLVFDGESRYYYPW